MLIIIGHRNDRNNLVFRQNMNYETFNKISGVTKISNEFLCWNVQVNYEYDCLILGMKKEKQNRYFE